MNSLTLTKKLLKIESTADNPNNLKNAIQVANKYLSSNKIVLRKYLINNKPSLVATMSNIKTPKIMLNGHLDVVPAKPKQYEPFVKGDRLYARGAQDMKTACAIMMIVFKKLAYDKTFPRNKLGLMLVTDEEIGGFHGSKALLQKGFKPKFLMTGESTDFDIEIAAKGVLWLKLTSKGKSAHAAYLWEGNNAITPMATAIQSIKQLYPHPKKEIWKTTCNVSSISGGNATNRVPDECELKLDIRYIPKDNPQVIMKRIKNNIPKGIKLEIIEKEPFLKTNANHPNLKLLKKLVKKISGKTARFVKKHGASDARFFSDQGIATTSFGPIGKGLHSDNEWVSLTSLKQYEEILLEFLK